MNLRTLFLLLFLELSLILIANELVHAEIGRFFGIPAKVIWGLDLRTEFDTLLLSTKPLEIQRVFLEGNIWWDILSNIATFFILSGTTVYLVPKIDRI